MADSRRDIVLGLCLVGLLAASASPRAAEQPARLALRGYDPVAYFTDGRPVVGLPEFAAAYEAATYHFKNAEHRALFIANPDRYVPQYSGYCAIDMSRGLKTEPDPEAWTIADGKLFVFGKPRGPGVFAQDGAAIVAKANQNWADLRKQP